MATLFPLYGNSTHVIGSTLSYETLHDYFSPVRWPYSKPHSVNVDMFRDSVVKGTKQPPTLTHSDIISFS